VREDPREPNDADLPRSERRYPYSALNDAERAEIRCETNAILLSIDPMIKNIVRRRMPKASAADRADVCQDVRWHIASYSLSKYDAYRNTKVSTFLHRCIANVAYEANDRWQRQRNSFPSPLLDETAISSDTLHDRAIEALADIVLHSPETLGLTAGESRIVRAMTAAGPDTQNQTVARELGYAQPSTLSMVLQRARNRLRRIDLICPE
jgi:DNA-directed RNA polymerase specialized sigma24 family protein